MGRSRNSYALFQDTARTSPLVVSWFSCQQLFSSPLCLECQQMDNILLLISANSSARVIPSNGRLPPFFHRLNQTFGAHVSPVFVNPLQTRLSRIPRMRNTPSVRDFDKYRP